METKWDENRIWHLLNNNDRAVDRAMVALYNRQTASERVAETTHESNGRGFNYYDAKPGSYYAKWVLAGNHLSGRHLVNARRLAIKYRRQLAEEANEREAAANAAERLAIQDEPANDG